MNEVTVTSPEQLLAVASEAFGPMMFAGSRPRFQRGWMAQHDLGDGLSLVDARADPSGASPAVHLQSTADADVLRFGVHVVGRARVVQHGRVADVVPASGVLYEARAGFELDFPTHMRSVTLSFPSALLPVRSSVITEHCARSLLPDWSSMRLLYGYLGQLSSVVDGLAANQRHDVGRVALELIAMTLRDQPIRIPESEGAADVVLGVMRRHVRDHLADTRLTVEELARRHHVSLRQTHALFATMDTTPGKYLREQRLQVARSMLADPGHDARTVSSVAASVGFANVRTFERAFRREYGMSPGQWRAEQRGAAFRRSADDGAP